MLKVHNALIFKPNDLPLNHFLEIDFMVDIYLSVKVYKTLNNLV